MHVVPTYIPAWRYGGPIRSVHGLCRALAQLGHEVHVYTTSVNGPDDSPVLLHTPVDMDGVKVWYFRSKVFRRLYWAPEMKRRLQTSATDFDLVHLHSIYLWPTFMASRIARNKAVPYIVSPRGMLVQELIEKKNAWLKKIWIHCIEKRTLFEASAIHMTSLLESKEAFRFGIKPESCFVVPNGVEEFPENLSSSGADSKMAELLRKKPLIAYIGRINWKKGLDRLIPAMKHVPDAHLVIAGNDEEEYTPKLKKLAEQAEVDGRLTFVGPLLGKDKEALLRHAAFFVMPSYQENFGNAALEAMAAGCPVLVSPHTGISDIVEKTGAGVVSSIEPSVLGKRMNELLSQPEVLKQMGQMGRRAAKEQYSWNQVALEMIKKYQEILSRPRTA